MMMWCGEALFLCSMFPIGLTQQQIKSWHDDDDYCNDNRIVEWYEVYQKRKTQKAKIKEELMTIAWHPDWVMDWCMSEDEKRWWE